MSADDLLSSSLIPAALRDAIQLSPDNSPLLLHAAETVLRRSGLTEAEALFKRALALDPDSVPAKLGLASAFYQQGKSSAALVVVETLLKHESPAPRALLLHARLSLQAGETRTAALQYARACAADPSLVDGALEQDLGPDLPRRNAAAASRQAAVSPAPFDREEEEHPETDYPFGDGDPTAKADRSSHHDSELPGDKPPPDVERPQLDFSAVGGMEAVKDEIRMKIILPLQQPQLFEAYGKKVGGGILLYGPPGCGKTFLARATAGEVNAAFVGVGMGDVLDMWIGQSERNLHGVFEQARGHRPCVLFFDEVDALGANRSDMLKSGGRQIINQFLAELDGLGSSNEGVLVLAATNAPWHLDPAFRRPGRFDRIIFVPPPDRMARAAILRLMLRGKPVDELDFEQVARKTDGFSGADLKAVVDLAVEAKLREAMKAGAVRPIGQRDLLDAAKRHKPSVRDWFETARNYALYANQSGLYDDILAHLKLAK